MVDQKVLNDKKLPKIEKIALLNDELRKKLITGELFKADSKDKAYITRGASVFANGMNRMQFLNNVALYRNFTEDNNPHGERDFGNFMYQKEKIFWKIDYKDNAMMYHSPDASDPSQTIRVLTIMKASEW
jgi:hypothetical protein|tara:strand:- start:1049 stop:1438 length:390 start_codon:yes stop_codon:yes gene_type:complete